LFRRSRKYDPGCSSRILIFYPSRIPGTGTGSWIRIRNAVWKCKLRLTWPSLEPVEMICIRPDWYRCALGSASASEHEQFLSYSHGSESRFSLFYHWYKIMFFAISVHYIFNAFSLLRGTGTLSACVLHFRDITASNHFPTSELKLPPTKWDDDAAILQNDDAQPSPG
jgi:hypothetical protein